MGALEEELHGSITGWRAFVSEFNREAIAIVSAVVIKVCATSLGEMPSSEKMQATKLTRPFVVTSLFRSARKSAGTTTWPLCTARPACLSASPAPCTRSMCRH